MSRVNTVLGPVPAEELGIVAVHEHIGYGMPGSEPVSYTHLTLPTICSV